MELTQSQLPISHVKVVNPADRNTFNEGTEDQYDDVSGRVKYNALGKTEKWHKEDARTKEHHTTFINKKARAEGKTPVVKIN